MPGTLLHQLLGTESAVEAENGTEQAQQQAPGSLAAEAGIVTLLLVKGSAAENPKTAGMVGTGNVAEKGTARRQDAAEVVRGKAAANAAGPGRGLESKDTGRTALPCCLKCPVLFRRAWLRHLSVLPRKLSPYHWRTC